MKNTQIPLCLSILGVFLILVIIAAAAIDQYQHFNPPSSLPDNSQYTPNTYLSNLKVGRFVGNIAPDFTLKTIDDKEITFIDYRGKNVILNFWATWCGPCKYETPFLQNYVSEYTGSDIQVIAICTQDLAQNVSNYVKANRLSYIIPLDPQGKVANLYGISGLPTTIFIDRNGVIKSIKIGPFINQDEIAERIKTMD